MNIYATTHRQLQGPVAEGGRILWGAAAAASIGVGVYHGMKRNGGSIGWGVWWGFMGALFPVITPAVAVAQGLSTCKNNCAGVRGPRRRRR